MFHITINKTCKRKKNREVVGKAYKKEPLSLCFCQKKKKNRVNKGNRYIITNGSFYTKDYNREK